MRVAVTGRHCSRPTPSSHSKSRTRCSRACRLLSGRRTNLGRPRPPSLETRFVHLKPWSGRRQHEVRPWEFDGPTPPRGVARECDGGAPERIRDARSARLTGDTTRHAASSIPNRRSGDMPTARLAPITVGAISARRMFGNPMNEAHCDQARHASRRPPRPLPDPVRQGGHSETESEWKSARAGQPQSHSTRILEGLQGVVNEGAAITSVTLKFLSRRRGPSRLPLTVRGRDHPCPWCHLGRS